MSGRNGQISLDLAPKPDFSLTRFEQGTSNQAAVNAIKKWPDWPAPIMALQGGRGHGKTHLGRAWAELSNAVIIDGINYPDVKREWQGRAIFLDRADVCAESVLFAVMNMALNGDIEGLLMAARRPPKDWSVELPDLRSRLRNVHVLTLGEHEDALLEPVIRKLFEDRGRQVSRDCVTYMIMKCDRSVSALRDVVEKLDMAAQAQRADLTKAFIARQLKSIQ